MCVCVCVWPRFFDVFTSKNRRIVLFLLLSDFPGSWVGGFLLSLISRLNSLWKCPNEHFGLLFRTPHTQEIDGLTLPGRPSTLIGCRPRIDAVLSPVFGKWPPKHPFNERSKIRSFCIQTLSLEPLEKPPFWPSFSTGTLSFREGPLFGVQPVLAAFVTTLQLGWWSVASLDLTFTRKCLLRASDCWCGNGSL